MARGVGIRELEPPKYGPRGGDPDEAALPDPGGLGTDPEGCPRSPPPGALVRLPPKVPPNFGPDLA